MRSSVLLRLLDRLARTCGSTVCTWRPISATDATSSSVADATDWTLTEASSDAAATAVESCWVVAAVEVSLPAEASSCAEAADTVWTISPTADSNSSASRAISALRPAAARRSASAFSSASCRACSAALILKSSTACAISPISSPRPRPGSTTAKSPPRELLHAAREPLERLGHAAGGEQDDGEQDHADDAGADQDRPAHPGAVGELRLDHRGDLQHAAHVADLPVGLGRARDAVVAVDAGLRDHDVGDRDAHDRACRCAPPRA